MSIYQVAGGIAFILFGLSTLFSLGIPSWVMGVAFVVAGIALIWGK